MDGVLSHLCAHIGYTGSRQPPEDGEMNEMTPPSKHRKNEPWRSEVEHTISRSRMLSTILNL